MWGMLKSLLVVVLVFAGIYIGVAFVSLNPGIVNVQFPFLHRETGEIPLGQAVVGAVGAGVLVGVVLGLAALAGMTFYLARLKREIRHLKKEVDGLRNLPLLDEDLADEGDDEAHDGQTDLEESGYDATRRSAEVASGPVRGGSTVAPLGGDDDDEDEEEDDDDKPALGASGRRALTPAPADVKSGDDEEEDDDEDDKAPASPVMTRKIDVP